MKRRSILPVVACLLLAAFTVGQALLLKSRCAVAGPAMSEGAFAALGGLRSIAAEIIWFRADRLQEEGRYVELSQLASALTLMEPHTPEVWSYAAWNLAYNISVMMTSPDDRWRWVDAGLRLLRDDALAYNPGEAELYRELAWMFELKLGANIDSAAPRYREKWRAIIEDVKARNAWHELRMEPSRMRAIEVATKCKDWTDPQLSAIYWASKGLEHARPEERPMLGQIIRQAHIIYTNNHKNLVK